MNRSLNKQKDEIGEINVENEINPTSHIFHKNKAPKHHKS